MAYDNSEVPCGSEGAESDASASMRNLLPCNCRCACSASVGPGMRSSVHAGGMWKPNKKVLWAKIPLKLQCWSEGLKVTGHKYKERGMSLTWACVMSRTQPCCRSARLRWSLAGQVFLQVVPKPDDEDRACRPMVCGDLRQRKVAKMRLQLCTLDVRRWHMNALSWAPLTP